MKEAAPPARDVSVRCTACGEESTRVKLARRDGSWYFIYQGIEGGNGPAGDPVSNQRAQQLSEAFHDPLTYERVHQAGLHDDAGFCGECRAAYCYSHWRPSPTGYGTCPAGHGKSLDPHWSPDM